MPCRSKLSQIRLRIGALVLEVLILAEFTEKGEQHVQGLDHGLIILKLVNRDIDHGANQSRIVGDVHVDLRARERNASKRLLQLRIPLLHERVKLGHVLCVIDCWGWSALVQILHRVHPPADLLRFLISILDRIDVHGRGTDNILALHVFQLENGLVLVVEGRLVQHNNSQVLFSSVRLGHLQEGIDLTHSRDILRNERLQLRIQVDFLWLVPVDILKEFFRLTGHR